MRYFKYYALVLLLIVVGCKKEDPEPELQSEPSQIQLEFYSGYDPAAGRLNPSSTIETGGETSITVAIKDNSSNSRLSKFNIKWSTNMGYFDNDNKTSVNWHAPDEPGMAIITVKVESEDEYGELSDSIKVISRTDSIIFSPDYLNYGDTVTSLFLTMVNPGARTKYVGAGNYLLEFEPDEDQEPISFPGSVSVHSPYDSKMNKSIGSEDSITVEIGIDRSFLHSGERRFILPFSVSTEQFGIDIFQNLTIDFIVLEEPVLIVDKNPRDTPEFDFTRGIGAGISNSINRSIPIEKEGTGDLLWEIVSELDWVDFPINNGLILYPGEIEVVVKYGKVPDGAFSVGTIDLKTNGGDHKYNASFFQYDIYKKVCQGEIISEATTYYNPDGVGIHPTVILKDGSVVKKEEWWPSKKEDIELVVCISTSEIQLATCVYTDGYKIYRAKEMAEVIIYEPKTGDIFYEDIFYSDDPDICPSEQTFSPGQDLFYSAYVNIDDIIDNIKGYIEVQ